MKYTFIMPAYNAGKTIERAIRSIMNQTYNDLQIIIIDDGSEDNTLDIIKSLAEEDKRIEYYHKENGGIGSALILGLKKTKGDYTIFVDSDDYIVLDLVEKVNLAVEEKPAEVVQYGITFYKSNGEKESDYLFKKQTLVETNAILKDYFYGCIKGINYPGLCIRAIRSTILKDFNYYSKSLAIDEVLIVHILSRTNVISFIDGSYYCGIIYQSSVSNSKLTSDKIKGQFEGLSLLPEIVSAQDSEVQLLVRIKLLCFIAGNYNLFAEAFGYTETRRIVRQLYSVYKEKLNYGTLSNGLKCYMWLLRYCPGLIRIKNRI